MAGKLLLDELPVATVYSPNLTTGRGGLSADYSDEDYLRAIRYGVGADGRALWIMPSHEYYYLSDEDTAAVIGVNT